MPTLSLLTKINEAVEKMKKLSQQECDTLFLRKAPGPVRAAVITDDIKTYMSSEMIHEIKKLLDNHCIQDGEEMLKILAHMVETINKTIKEEISKVTRMEAEELTRSNRSLLEGIDGIMRSENEKVRAIIRNEIDVAFNGPK